MTRVTEQYDFARQYLAGGVSASTRVNRALGHPMYFDRADGCRLWDLDGNYGESIFRHVYSRGASAALIVGDGMRRSTLEHMVRLAGGFQDAMPGRYFSFVVNKVDLLEAPDQDALPEALRTARQPLIWTSALTAYNVKTAFRQTADAIKHPRDHT